MTNRDRINLETRIGLIFAYFIFLSTVLITVYASTNFIILTNTKYEDLKAVEIAIFDFPRAFDLPLLNLAFITVLFFTLLVFFTGEITGNVSQVDKLWSILPCIYVWETGLLRPNPRVLLMLFVSTVWGIRLTYNFNRRGGYGWPPWTGEEDYRWIHVRKWPIICTKLGWSAFNLFFISIYQNILLFLTASPVIICSEYESELCLLDYMLSLSCLMLVWIEYTADEQQYIYQTEKYTRINNKSMVYPFSIGFPTHGLFSVSRHPNYAAEISFWFLFYLYTLLAGARWYNWSLSGSVLLCLLFQGSTLLSETITSKKYPKYKRYKEKVPRFLDFWNIFQAEFPEAIADE